jgi:hypothetical protein
MVFYLFLLFLARCFISVAASVDCPTVTAASDWPGTVLQPAVLQSEAQRSDVHARTPIEELAGKG